MLGSGGQPRSRLCPSTATVPGAGGHRNGDAYGDDNGHASTETCGDTHTYACTNTHTHSDTNADADTYRPA